MDPSLLVIGGVALAFFIGASAKGALGFGMPAIALPLMASLVDVRVALALLSLSLVLSNVWLLAGGGYVHEILRRFWWMFPMIGIGCALGASILASLPPEPLYLLVGIVVLASVALNVAAPSLRIPAHRERLLGLVFGFVGGVAGGMSTLFGPPLILYFTSLHLARDYFVATVSTVLLFASLLVVTSYLVLDILTLPLLGLSALCLLPMLAGLWFGRFLRERVDPVLFRRAVLAMLFAAGLNLVRRALV